MNSSPIAADIWSEWRSKEFREHMSKVVNLRPALGFHAARMKDLPSDYRDSAYAVIYYFNQVGTLVAFGLVGENLAIGVLGSWIVQTWQALEPVIIGERRHRADIYPPDAPANFSDYFEHLVQCVLDRGGREAMNTIQGQIGIKHLATPLLNDKTEKRELYKSKFIGSVMEKLSANIHFFLPPTGRPPTYC